MWTICASRVSLADPLGAHDEGAGAVDGAADDLVARRLLDRDRLAGDHRLVDRAPPLEDDAVDRHLLARPDPQAVAERDLLERHVSLGARRPPPAAPLRRQIEQGARAPPVRLLARSSSTCPSRTRVMITAAGSK